MQKVVISYSSNRKTSVDYNIKWLVMLACKDIME